MSWLAQAEAKRRAYFRSLAQKAPRLDYNSVSRGYSWTYIATKISDKPDAVYPFNPDIAKRIKEFTKGQLKPIWIVDVYMSPRFSTTPKLEKFGRHGIAQKVSRGKAQFYLNGDPYKIWYQWTGEKDSRAGDLPGAYVPFDGRAWKLVKANWRDWSREDLAKLYQGLDPDNYDRELEKREAYAAELEREVQKYAQKRLERVAESDIRDYMLGRDLPHNRLEPSKAYSK